MELLKTPEQYLSEWGVFYEKKGDGNLYIRCISGTHYDNNPSLSIHPEKGIFKCWSCGFRGNIFILYKHFTGKGFRDFMKENGCDDTVKVENTSLLSSVPIKKKNSAKEYSEIILKEGSVYDITDKQKPFLQSIGIYSEKFVKEYEIKWTPFARFIAEHKDSEEEKGTPFYKRLLVPIYYNNQLVNMEGRAYIDGVNPKVIYAKGGQSDLLFNYDRIDFNKPVVLVEGIKDLFKVWNINKNVISCLGTSLGKLQIKQLNKIKDLIVFIDDDDAGDELLNSIDEVYDYDFRVVDPKKGRDPNDLTLSEIKYKLDNEVETYWDYLARKFPMKDEFSLGGRYEKRLE